MFAVNFTYNLQLYDESLIALGAVQDRTPATALAGANS